MSRIALALVVGVSGQSTTVSSQFTMIIGKLNNMKQKVVEMKQHEEEQHAAYAQYCRTEDNNSVDQIEQLKDQIAESKAQKETQGARAAQKAQDMKKANEAAATASAELEKLNTERKAEKEEFQLLETDFNESIRALKDALAHLKSQKMVTSEADAPAADLIQTASRALESVGANSKLAAFLQAPEGDALVWNKDRSSSVIGMLEKLEDKFTAEKTSLQTQESANQKSYQAMKETLIAESSTQKQTAESSQEAMSEAQGQKEQAAQAELTQTAAWKDEKKGLEDLRRTCKETAELFARRQAGMSQDISAFEGAVNVLKGQSFLQTSSYLQLARSDSNAVRLQRMKMFLQKEGASQRNAVLSQIAESADPFEKVKTLVRDLITRLEAEAAQEQGEQAWCNERMKENKKDVEKHSSTVAENTEIIAQMASEMETKTREMEETKKDVSEKSKSLTAAQTLRTDERKQFDTEEAELTSMEEALGQAIDIVSSSGIALLQQPAFDAVTRGNEEYERTSGSIVELLENCKLNVRTELNAAVSEEDKSKTNHNNFVTETKTSIASLNGVINVKKTEIDDAKQRKNTAEADLSDGQQLLEEAQGQEESLQEKCVHAQSTEERAKARAAEIDSLQEALEILQGQ